MPATLNYGMEKKIIIYCGRKVEAQIWEDGSFILFPWPEVDEMSPFDFQKKHSPFVAKLGDRAYQVVHHLYYSADGEDYPSMNLGDWKIPSKRRKKDRLQNAYFIAKRK